MAKERTGGKNDWRSYERAAVAHAAEELGVGLDLTATPNAKLKGALSGVARQIDLLVEGRSAATQHERIIVDAKRHGNRLDVKDVEAFEGMMRDRGASHGILVCPNGWSFGAQRRASNQIKLIKLPVEDGWDPRSHAEYTDCEGSCLYQVDVDRKGLVLWDGQLLLTVDAMHSVVFTGKCDVCRSFHVWCWDCGEVFALQTAEQFTCSCDRLWITMNSEDETTSEQFHFSPRTGLPLDQPEVFQPPAMRRSRPLLPPVAFAIFATFAIFTSLHAHSGSSFSLNPGAVRIHRHRVMHNHS